MQLRRVLVSEDSSQTFLESQQRNVYANQTRRLQTRHFLLGRPGALRVPQLRIMVRRTGFSASCLGDAFPRVRLLVSVF